MNEILRTAWLEVVGLLTLTASIVTSTNAIIHKRDARSAAGWVAVIWLAPLVGAVLYVLLGINRIRRRATELRGEHLRLRATTAEMQLEHESLTELLPPEGRHLAGIGQLVDRVTRIPLVGGNTLSPLMNGEEAYPDMLAAIDAASETVALGTYIFDNDAAGMKFVESLAKAVARGVEVRVLIDSVGARYSWPRIVKVLERRRVPVRLFLHSMVPWRMPYMNLRNHRKLLIIDGTLGFTGGMNLRQGHMVAAQPRSPVKDIHFRIEGPVVGQMMHVFAEDWAFTTKERLEGDRWFPHLDHRGPVVARGIPDGPDGDLDKLRWTLLGALARAQHSIKIVTPYFLPDTALITSLNVAAMRGVKVDIILPEKNNLPMVKWAASAQLWQLLGRDCQVHMSPPPFDHTKLMVVDNAWSLIGSGNWDQRSLRLNFEFNIECYDAALATRLNHHIDGLLDAARPLTKSDVDGRSFLVQLRDGIARLFSPYL